MNTFRDRVFSILKTIPKGSVLTYKQVAERAGNEKASRAVGNIIGTNYDPDIPCHRVVRSNGELGGYNRGIEKKRSLLHSEGVKLKGDKLFFKRYSMITKLSTEQVKEQLALLGVGWESIEEKFLQKSYTFDSFVASLAFVNQVGDIAEASGHHPDIHIHYDKVLLELWTHDVEGISEKDFALAEKIEGLTQMDDTRQGV